MSKDIIDLGASAQSLGLRFLKRAGVALRLGDKGSYDSLTQKGMHALDVGRRTRETDGMDRRIQKWLADSERFRRG